jgi:adenine/guanine phosphoribosyltransferase-like PRPP-binding protein
MIDNPAFANRRVLVIDDVPATHDTLHRILGPERGAEATLLDAERAPGNGRAPQSAPML